MTPIAPHITAFLRERLPVQRAASEHTCASYAYAFKLLFQFASERLKVTPSDLQLEQLDARLVMDFLDHLECKRGNGPRSRNARLAAIKSFMRFVEHRVPSLLEQSRQILALPSKRTEIKLVNHLSMEEVQAILEAPDLRRHGGVRDRAMLHLCFAAGLRVSELVALPLSAVTLHPSPSIRVQGKGRRERGLPLWKQTATDLRAWIAVRGISQAPPELFLSARGIPMSRSGFEYVLRKHAAAAAKRCPSLPSKQISPHVLRHSCAMMILQATGDLRKVSLWLGHADMVTTQIYLRADPTEKLDAIEAVVPPALKRGRFRPPDALIASLQPPDYAAQRRAKAEDTQRFSAPHSA
jgi:site-specific recombinase XerD